MSSFSNEAQDVLRVEDHESDAIRSELGSDYGKVVAGAEAAAVHEQQDLSVVEAFRKHWKAALWSLGLSTALVMEGYDVVVINSFYGSNAFIDRFGTVVGSSKVTLKECRDALAKAGGAGEKARSHLEFMIKRREAEASNPDIAFNKRLRLMHSQSGGSSSTPISLESSRASSCGAAIYPSQTRRLRHPRQRDWVCVSVCVSLFWRDWT